MANGSFTLKTIRVIVETEGSGQVLDVQSLPVSAKVAKTGGETNSSAEITIYNLALEKVQQLTALTFKNLTRPRTIVKVYAGGKGASLSLIYEGDVVRAVPKFDIRGNLSITFSCIVGYFSGHDNVVPTSVGEVGMKIGVLLKKLAGENVVIQMVDAVKDLCVSVGSAFVDDVTATLKKLSRDYGITIIREGDVITVSPMSPTATDVYALSRGTGLLGYPSFTSSGVTCKAIFDPKFKVQTFFRIDSLLPGTDGIWQATKVEYSLEANMPKGGDWTMVVTAIFKETDSSSGAIAAQDGGTTTTPKDTDTTDTASDSDSSSDKAPGTQESDDTSTGLSQQEITSAARGFEASVGTKNEYQYSYENMQEGEDGYNDSQISAVLGALNKSIVTAKKLAELGYPEGLITGAGYTL